MLFGGRKGELVMVMGCGMSHLNSTKLVSDAQFPINM